MISVKLGCKLDGIQPELLLGIIIMHGVFEKHGFDLMVTEATGSKHMVGSLHYKGLAADIRTHDIPTDAMKYQILNDCVHALGSDFDLILENIGKPIEHLHLEWDPQ